MYDRYSVKAAALTIGVAAKWVDNVLSHYFVIGVVHGKRGVERRLGDETILALAVCRLLAKDLGVPIGNAVAIANHVVTARGTEHGRYQASTHLALAIATEDIERSLQSRLLDAVESVGHVRRGRPPRHPRDNG